MTLNDQIREWVYDALKEHAAEKCAMDDTVPAALAAVRAVADLHEVDTRYDGSLDLYVRYCASCGDIAPSDICRTLYEVAVELDIIQRQAED